MPYYPEIVDASSDLYSTAPIILEGRAEFDVEVGRVWNEVEEFQWIPTVTATWETTSPHTRGSRRRLTLGPLLLSNEFVTRVDPGREMSFYIGEIPVPGMRAIAERITLERLGPGRCALTYRIAAAPVMFPPIRLRFITFLVGPLFSLALKRLIGRSLNKQTHNVKVPI
ncbi:SRPBCC family protein [Mycobacteroides chelonae]|uniref:SRPBCC family protein n=1 Tax=Mycobacteroides chelonae TaxID=1774 RepID=A0A1S1M6N5_MYCCH|nr:SRPBCC family protein [Mycobacteroides chelonae]OHU53276.1 hypothetical protein BKG81_05490 [Mycobacteroides chelonae]OHU78193.1 hypothetical protein BKG84_07110 [Mycobacteroides chelonae]QQG86623.1 hypothetical protein HBA99_04730 [Mycobacteroides chelonae]QQG91440.1 hypothetical protein HBA97_04730 [Mycobacteroides chelonae]